MYFTATISAYDCFDKVVVSAVVYEHGGIDADGAIQVLKRSWTTTGEGLDDPARWLLNALVSTAEQL